MDRNNKTESKLNETSKLNEQYTARPGDEYKMRPGDEYNARPGDEYSGVEGDYSGKVINEQYPDNVQISMRDQIDSINDNKRK